MFAYLLSAACVCLCVAVNDAALVIRPPGNEFVKAIGRSMVLTCEERSHTAGSTLIWKDTRNRDVSENSRHR